MAADPDCLFCKIVAGTIASTKVHEDALVVAFRDRAPRAPTHILVIPRDHIASAVELSDADGPMLGRLFATAADLSGMLALAQDVVRLEGLTDRGHRLVFNVGRDSGNTVPHLHLHVLGGRSMGWPPG